MAQPLPSEIERLTDISLFEGVSRAQVAIVARAAVRRKGAGGSFLFMQGDPAEYLYVLIEGRVRLTQVTPEGQQIILHYASPGEAIAVIAALSEASYPVSAEVVEESQVLAWSQAAIRRLMEQYPSIAVNALRILAGRVREFQDRIRELSTERVERRIARALLRLASQTGRKVTEGVLIDFPLSRQDLAEMTGTTLFTVSRTLSGWESRGLIKAGRERVVVCFPHGLVQIAEDLPADRNPDSPELG